MKTIIHTTKGTYIVSPENEAELVKWLEQNAVKAGPKNSRDQFEEKYSSRKLINENKAV
jgi:hypothetical protein